MSDEHHWQAGDVVALRYLRNTPGDLIIPATVVHDGDDYTALYIAPGTPLKAQATRDGQRLGRDIPFEERDRMVAGFRDAVWTGSHSLSLHRPGRWSAIRLFWRESDWEFNDYYGNIEAPFVRSSVGFDTADYLLDVVVAPDRTWRWKDEDEWELALEHGLIAPGILDEVRREGERIIADAEANAWPFNAGFESWRPDPSWAIPALPDGWDAGLHWPE